jgi:dihydroflavonol-4-reductase
LGANIVKHLNARGCDVRVLMREQSSTAAIEDLDYDRAIGDIRAPETLEPAMDGIDWVFHVAASTSIARRHWKRAHEINHTGTRNVVRAALASGVRRLVHTSSAITFGIPDDGQVGDETLEWNRPFDFAYRHSKRMAEQEVLEAVDRGLEAVIVNPAFVFGERDVNFNAGRLLIEMRKRRIPFATSGGRTIVDADAAAKAHIAAAERGVAGERYILGGDTVSNVEMLQTIADVVGAKAPRAVLPDRAIRVAGRVADFFAALTGKEPPLSFDIAFESIQKRYYSSDKAMRTLGFEPVPHRESISKCFRWYLATGRVN